LMMTTRQIGEQPSNTGISRSRGEKHLADNDLTVIGSNMSSNSLSSMITGLSKPLMMTTREIGEQRSIIGISREVKRKCRVTCRISRAIRPGDQ
jgi:hypothetical protein